MKDKGSPLTIKDGVVVKCDKNATEVVIPEGVMEIGHDAFSDCTSLESVVIPAGVEKIGSDAFSNCTSLKSLTIPAGITEIKEHTFRSCVSLESVTIPASVKTIGRFAFYRCKSLSSVAIPAGVRKIEASAFDECETLAEIRFGGTKAQWDAVKKGAEWHRFTPAFCEKCADGDVPLPLYKAKDGVLKYWYRIVKEAVIPDGVEKIGDYPFYMCSWLESVVIPASVTEIEFNAFERCTSLSEIRFGGTMAQWESVEKGLECFKCVAAEYVKCADGDVPLPPYSVEDGVLECWNRIVKEAVIPEGVTAIGECAFAGHMSLESVTIPASVKTIDALAFNACHSLASVVIPDGVEKILPCAFDYCTSLASVEIPGSVKTVGVHMFADCTSLASVVIHNGVKKILSGAFADCTSLKKIVIPASVKEIGLGAFSARMCDCDAPLTDVRYGGTKAQWLRISGLYRNRALLRAEVRCADGTVRPEERADGFLAVGSIVCGYMDTDAVTLEIPAGMTAICDRAFEENVLLKSVVIPDSVTAIDSDAFSGCKGIKKVQYNGTLTQWCSLDASFRFNLKNITLGDGMNLKKITTLTIPDGVMEIGDYAFCKCASLESVVILASVKKIGYDVFESCKSLKSVTIPSGVREIGYNAFSDCASLESVVIPAGVEKIGSHAFCNCTSLKSVIIPGGVREIGDWVFTGCKSLASVEIHGSVKKIGLSMFKDCASLIDIRYGGTKAQWKRLKKGSGWNDGVPAKVVHCADGDAEV